METQNRLGNSVMARQKTDGSTEEQIRQQCDSLDIRLMEAQNR